MSSRAAHLPANRIHPTAIVHPEASLGGDVEIGAYAVVGAGVALGRGTRIGAHAVIEGPAVFGAGNVVHSFAALGGPPQDRRYRGGPTGLRVGDGNTFREHVTVHRGVEGDTVIGDECLFMVGCHVAHDARIGSRVTLANGVQLAGHVRVEDHATFGGLAGLAQHVTVGESAFVAAGAMCERDVPPFVVVQGDRARVRALNKVGLRRRGVDDASIDALDAAFRAIFVRARGGPSRRDVLAATDVSDPFVARLVAALRAAE